MKYRSVQRVLLVLIVVSHQGTADAGTLKQPRILLLGDSWAHAIYNEGIFDSVLEEQGLGHFSVIGETTTRIGSKAEDWADPVMFESISAALDAHPTVDTVHISLGINETISAIIDAAGGDLTAYADPDFLPDPAVLEEALDTYISNMTTIITGINGERPELIIGISSYEYLAGRADPRLVPWFLELATRQRKLAATIEGCVFLHHFGILQYTFGVSPFVGPREVPYPGAPPFYIPFPGGDPTLPSPPEGGPTADHLLTAFHLNEVGYALVVANSMDQLYGSRLVGLPDPLCQIATSITDIQLEEYVATFGVDTTASGGLPLIASLELLGTASCRLDEAAGRTVARAFYANKASLDLELAAPDLEEFAEVLAALLALGSQSQAEVADVLSAHGIVLRNEYRVVFCEAGVACAEAAFAQVVLGGSTGELPAGAQEPFSGNGDIDGDGVSNLEEYEAVIARGGSVGNFVAAALDPTRDGTENLSSADGGVCFIATAAYGTPLEKRINVLRRLRDNSMLTTAAGTAFVDTYYRLSPPIAQHLAGNPTARRIVRSLLDELVTTVEFGRRLAHKLHPPASE